MKKEWKKPEISILVRGSAEENVLTVCKSSANVDDHPDKCGTESGLSGISSS